MKKVEKNNSNELALTESKSLRNGYIDKRFMHTRDFSHELMKLS